MRTSETAGSGKPRQSTHIPTNIEKIEAKIWTSLFPLFSFDQQHCCVCSTTKTAMQSTTLSSATYGIHQKRKWGKMKDFLASLNSASMAPFWIDLFFTIYILQNMYQFYKLSPMIIFVNFYFPRFTTGWRVVWFYIKIGQAFKYSQTAEKIAWVLVWSNFYFVN